MSPPCLLNHAMAQPGCILLLFLGKSAINSTNFMVLSTLEQLDSENCDAKPTEDNKVMLGRHQSFVYYSVKIARCL